MVRHNLMIKLMLKLVGKENAFFCIKIQHINMKAASEVQYVKMSR